MKPQPKAPPTLEEARERYSDQIFRIRRSSEIGTKRGKHDEWELISKVEMLDSPFFKVTNPYNGHTTDLRPSRMRELAEWLIQVIRTKNHGRKLEHLSVCLKTKSGPRQAKTTDLQFLHAIATFIFDDLEDESKARKASVPTLKQIRLKLGWTHKEVCKVAKRSGWQDLPHGQSGRPPKPSPAKKKKRGLY